MDIVAQFEPARLFAAREIRAKRFPLWTPYEYGGVPFIWPKYSPFLLLTCLSESPVILAWAQLLEALVAGIGAYWFGRRILSVSFWPATLIAWCYPLTAFFVLWQGFPTGAAVYWLPWLLLAVDATVRGRRMAPAGLALVTGLVLVSGHIDVAGQVLLIGGLYALWSLGNRFASEGFRWTTGKAMVALMSSWVLGFLLAAPHVLPLLEYARTGARIEERAGGSEERPPGDLTALPQVVLPHMYGSTERGSVPPLLSGMYNLSESAAAAYTGLLATLLVAPLAWHNPRQRKQCLFWALLALFGLSWCLGLPGFVDFLRLPGLNMMSHNRLVFATSFAILALSATGLEALLQGEVRLRWQSWLQLALLVGLFGWCLYHTRILPEPLASQMEKDVRAGAQFTWVRTVNDVAQAQTWFRLHYLISAGWCAVGLVAWFLLTNRRADHRLVTVVLGILMLADLLSFSFGRISQCDPALYYPPIPALQQVARAGTSRIIGVNAFPANLAQAVRLRDVRGYDSVDPGRWWALLRLAAAPGSGESPYAKMQWLTPRARNQGTHSIKLSPVLDMLGVRHVIFRGDPPPGFTPAFRSPDYWVTENPSALSRVYVPRRVEVVPDGNEMLYRLGQPEFDPRSVAYVEVPLNLPSECRGLAEIREDIPTRIVATVRMETAGLMVLADSWDKGWRAFVNGHAVPILRTNYAIRGVVLPAGLASVEFRYQPASLAWGLTLAGAATVILLGWAGVALFHASGSAGGVSPA